MKNKKTDSVCARISDRFDRLAKVRGGVFHEGIFAYGDLNCDINPILNSIDVVASSKRFTHLPGMIGTDITLPIASMYVELSVMQYSSFVRKNASPHLLSRGLTLADRQREREEYQEAKRVSLMDAVNDKTISNMVILGDPGSGKSSLLRYVAQKIVSNESAKWSIPIFISLRDYWYQRSQNPGMIESLSHFAAMTIWNERNQKSKPVAYTLYLNGHYEDSKESIRNIELALEEYSGENRDGVLFLLDGLDEVAGDKEAVEHITAEINHLSLKFASIVTSRYTGFHGGIVEDIRYDLMGLHRQSMDDLVTNWFAHYKASDSNEHRKSLLRQIAINSRLEIMARNPFLLSLLCFLKLSSRDSLPMQRSEIYRKLVKLIRTQFDNKVRSVVFDAHQLKCLSEFSYYLYTDAIRVPSQIFEQDDWDLFLGSKTEFSSSLHSLFLPSRLITSIGVEDRSYHFTHLTFHEYFVALELANHPISFVKKFLYMPHWRVVIRFVGGIYRASNRQEDYKVLLNLVLNPMDRLGLLYIEAAWLLLEADIEDSTDILGFDLRSELWNKFTSSQEYICDAAGEALSVLSPFYALEKCSQLIQEIAGSDYLNDMSKLSSSNSELLRDAIMLLGQISSDDADEVLMKFLIGENYAISSYARHAIALRNTPEIRSRLMSLDISSQEALEAVCDVISYTQHTDFYIWLLERLQSSTILKSDKRLELVCNTLEGFKLYDAQAIVLTLFNSFALEDIPQCVSRLYYITFQTVPENWPKEVFDQLDLEENKLRYADAVAIGVVPTEELINGLENCDSDFVEETLLFAVQERVCKAEIYEPELAQAIVSLADKRSDLKVECVRTLTQLESCFATVGIETGIPISYYRNYFIAQGPECPQDIILLLADSGDIESLELIKEVMMTDCDVYIRASAINAYVRITRKTNLIDKAEALRLLFELADKVGHSSKSTYLEEQIYSAIGEIDFSSLTGMKSTFSIENALAGACAEEGLLLFDNYYIDRNGEKHSLGIHNGETLVDTDDTEHSELEEDRREVGGDAIVDRHQRGMPQFAQLPSLDQFLIAESCSDAVRGVANHLYHDLRLATKAGVYKENKQKKPLFVSDENSIASIDVKTGNKLLAGKRIMPDKVDVLAKWLVHAFPLVQEVAKKEYQNDVFDVEKQYLHIVSAVWVTIQRESRELS